MLTATITGTLSELFQLWSVEKVCEMLGIDYYKVCMVPSDEVFTITADELVRVGILTKE